MSQYADLADRLEALVGELDELALDTLREAFAQGATARPATDRDLTRARRAVEKAAVILRTLDDGPDGVRST